ncbi:MAG: NADH-quinone oxidoreductase subunit NuoH [Euryarchaeota archaeon]|nr:NADH-quinone oxidoreductase subunit NuoH [Euryarchaeota archaeon]
MDLYSAVSGLVNWVVGGLFGLVEGLGLRGPVVVFLRDLYGSLEHAIITAVVAILVLVVGLLMVVLMLWIERKLIGRLADRRATMLGIRGIGRGTGAIQLFADAIKLFVKEDLAPKKADRHVFAAGPSILVASSVLVLVAIPMSEGFAASDLDGGLIFAMAVFGFAPFAVFLSGWSANNKYTLIGGMRSATQMISCEIPFLLSLVGVVILAGSFRLVDIVHMQGELWFIVLQPIAFVVYFIAMISEIERIPFDLPEAEAELVEGWQTEYSGLKFAFAMMSGYIRGYVGCALGVLLFFGGWSSPVPAYSVALPWGGEFSGPVPELWFLMKVLLLFMVLVWVRAALGRVRVDQIVNLGWKRLLPLALFNIALTVAFLIFAPELESDTLAMGVAFSVPSLFLVAMFWKWGWFR